MDAIITNLVNQFPVLGVCALAVYGALKIFRSIVEDQNTRHDANIRSIMEVHRLTSERLATSLDNMAEELKKMNERVAYLEGRHSADKE